MSMHDPHMPVRCWLYFLCAMIFAMVLVGGATRLTDSGLSITEWKPILGIIPPLSAADWLEAFQKYRQIPEYQIINKGMTMDAFKSIYWWEWGHRFLGRIIGFAFLIPFIFFWATDRIKQGLMPKLAVMFVLGGLQGALGWYMVTSGLVDRVDVSQYRLAAHMCTAVLIFGYILWVALGLRAGAERSGGAAGNMQFSALGLTALIFMQIALGAFVAGLDAGQGYNTWPLMDGSFIPGGLGAMSPWYLNLFENALTVQFNHRMAAYVIVLWTLLHAAITFRAAGEGRLLAVSALMVIAVLGQSFLGIWTLVAKVPLGLALTHQGGGVILFALSLAQLHMLMLLAQRAERA